MRSNYLCRFRDADLIVSGVDIKTESCKRSFTSEITALWPKSFPFKSFYVVSYLLLWSSHYQVETCMTWTLFRLFSLVVYPLRIFFDIGLLVYTTLCLRSRIPEQPPHLGCSMMRQFQKIIFSFPLHGNPFLNIHMRYYLPLPT